MPVPEYSVRRRTFLARAVWAGAALFAVPPRGWPAMPSDPVIETTAGKIKGFTVNGIAGFKGVPYGASTAGANRFMPPQKPEPWTGEREATAWAGHAPQASPGLRRPLASLLVVENRR
jgi:hypothetical protein